MRWCNAASLCCGNHTALELSAAAFVKRLTLRLRLPPSLHELAVDRFSCLSRGPASELFSDRYLGGLQAAEAPLARQPADAKPAALAGEGRSSATSGKPARLGGTARGARAHFDVA